MKVYVKRQLMLEPIYILERASTCLINSDRYRYTYLATQTDLHDIQRNPLNYMPQTNLVLF